MEYVPPLNGDLEDPGRAYANGSSGVPGSGSIPSARFFNLVQAELIALVDAAGIALDAEDDAQVAAAVLALIKAGAIGDVPFMAGFGPDGAGADLEVATYGYLVLARAIKLTGTAGYIEAPATGAAVVLDVEADGATIFQTAPQFAAGANAMTAGAFTAGAASLTLAAGTRLTFKVTQVGSSVAGQRLGFTLKGEAG